MFLTLFLPTSWADAISHRRAAEERQMRRPRRYLLRQSTFVLWLGERG